MTGKKRHVENSHPLAVGPWTSHLASLCLFPIRRIRIIMSTYRVVNIVQEGIRTAILMETPKYN